MKDTVISKVQQLATSILESPPYKERHGYRSFAHISQNYAGMTWDGKNNWDEPATNCSMIGYQILVDTVLGCSWMGQEIHDVTVQEREATCQHEEALQTKNTRCGLRHKPHARGFNVPNHAFVILFVTFVGPSHINNNSLSKAERSKGCGQTVHVRA